MAVQPACNTIDTKHCIAFMFQFKTARVTKTNQSRYSASFFAGHIVIADKGQAGCNLPAF